MMYATHKAGGALFALIGFEVLSKNNLLIPDISPWLQLVLMYPACSFGSTLPDLDHGWGSVKEHTPTSWVVHKLIHVTKPKHRSWQTHSLLMNIAIYGLMFSLLYAMSIYHWFGVSDAEVALIRLLLMGLVLGITSHLFLDAFTMAGIWLLPGVPLRFVPKSEIFGTGTTYETVWRRLLYVLLVLMLVWVLNPFGLQEYIIGLLRGGG